MMPNLIETMPLEEYITSGHLGCPGCGGPLAMRYALKPLGRKTMVVMPASCWSLLSGLYPYSNMQVPMLHIAFAVAASTASGVKAALVAQGDTETTVMAWAGDGGTFDIGFQALSAAVERNDDIIYACYDNEAYMNTGIQRSSATPWGAWTTTTPTEHPKDRPKKDIVAIMAAHRIPYVATATIAYPDDLMRKLEKARGIRGAKFIHILSPCPAGWKTEPGETVLISRLAVQTRVFPLYEIENGEQYTITVQPEEVRPVRDYLERQARFAHLTEAQREQVQENVDREWERLVERAGR